MKTFANPPGLHAPLACYSHQAEIRGPQRWLVLSGQIGMTPQGAVPEDAAAQLALALDNVLENLRAAQMRREDLITLTFYLVAPDDAARRRQIISEKLGEHEPCMTVVYVAGLASPALKVEIEGWACRDDG